MLESAPSLTDRIYELIVDEICDGRLPPGAHLVQERLAERFGTSRQPVQQAMTRLKADGMVEELGRRGLFVAPLEPQRTRDHYGIRAALDAWATRTAALRAGDDTRFAGDLSRRGRAILKAGRAAVRAGDVKAQVRCDDDFHFMIYESSGNEMVATAAEPHWRFLRRAMGMVLRHVELPQTIWRQHAEILDAIVAGDAATADRLATEHAAHAAERLVAMLEACRERESAI